MLALAIIEAFVNTPPYSKNSLRISQEQLNISKQLVDQVKKNTDLEPLQKHNGIWRKKI
ncbi:MAG: hypothetical protein ACMUEM_00350 [Flavobacteriales bacterium AspAUS03]